jgi:hypothetical protein
MIACVAIAAFAAPALAAGPSSQALNATQNVAPYLAYERTFSPDGQSAFGGNYGLGAGSLGQLQPGVVQGSTPYGINVLIDQGYDTQWLPDGTLNNPNNTN